VVLLQSCLAHSLRPGGRGDPPHAKERLNNLLQYCNQSSVADKLFKVRLLCSFLNSSWAADIEYFVHLKCFCSILPPSEILLGFFYQHIKKIVRTHLADINVHDSVSKEKAAKFV
jgi:hypothetical protein